MFYVLLAAVPVTAAATLVLFARVVDSANGGRHTILARAQTIIAATALAILVLAAAITSPVT